MVLCSSRLQDYERNQDFRGPAVIVPTEILIDWPTSGFSQLTLEHTISAQFPKISSAHIDGYFMHRMGLDKRAVGDSQALSKGKLMLESNRIEACSILHQNNEIYFSAICLAAMKKSVSTNDCYSNTEICIKYLCLSNIMHTTI